MIAKVPRKDFLPWKIKNTPMKYAKGRSIETTDEDSLYFVKISPRKNLLDFLPTNLLQQFLFFVRQNYVSRKTRVIPELE